jgi:molybdopterin-containing oxidoreductase family iron-sulfur binding subunit
MAGKNKPRIWTTIEEYENNVSVDELKQEEFFSKPEEVLGEQTEKSGIDRRDFLKLSGMASIFSMVSCSERPVQKIIPYVNAPEEIIPGIANYYASSSDEAGASVVIKTREGRPIQILPNELDKFSANGLNSRAQASIYDLYDPARARNPLKITEGKEKKINFSTAVKEIAEKTKEGRVALLSSSINGLARTKVVEEFLKTFKDSRHVVYTATTNEQLTEANKINFDTENLAFYRFDKADYVLSLGGDIVGDGRLALKYAKDLAKKRDVIKNKDMSRLTIFEPSMSSTGLMSDYHYKVRNEDMAMVALAIANQIVTIDGNSVYTSNNDVRNVLQNYSPKAVEEKLGLKEHSVSKVAKDLWKNRKKSIVYAEGNSNRTKNGVLLHTAVNFLNSILENVGKTIDYETNIDLLSGGSKADFLALVEEMNAGKISTLFVYDTNPVFFLGKDLKKKFIQGLKKVETVISFADRIDETAKFAHYLLPVSHSFESWGDREYTKGLYSIVQPTIAPIWNTKMFEESLMALASASDSKAFKDKKGQTLEYLTFIKNIWADFHKKSKISESFDKFWIKFVRDGIYETITDREETHKAYKFDISSLTKYKFEENTSDLSLSIFVSPIIYDGKQNNNPYLFELPDPVSKITWDNFVAVSPGFAKKYGLKINDILSLDVDGHRFTIPMNIQPGQRDDVLTISAGWGRTSVGPIGNGEEDFDGNNLGLGFDAFAITRSNEFSGLNVKFLGKTDHYKNVMGEYRLANLQGHQHLDDKFRSIEVDKSKHHDENFRPVVFETTLAEYKEDPTKAVHFHTEQIEKDVRNESLTNLWNNSNSQVHKYPGHRWGLAIDMNKCTSCNACTIACQVENNVPVVGKNEVLLGREMHWIRIDRYYVGDQENPHVIPQPMMCQHCENAPCETVCPVVATTHNAEGLNVMTYNRCVGTRYCANNCPYKVRRFNFHEYTKGQANKGFPQIGMGTAEGLDQLGYDMSTSPLQMMLNPDITVREKGVMEKCTMCNHIIREKKYEAKKQGVSVNELEFTVACATSCSADAIVFGDLNDPGSEVAKLRKEELAFASLGELNTLPSISYISKVRNQDEKIHLEEKKEH